VYKEIGTAQAVARHETRVLMSVMQSNVRGTRCGKANPGDQWRQLYSPPIGLRARIILPRQGGGYIGDRAQNRFPPAYPRDNQYPQC